MLTSLNEFILTRVLRGPCRHSLLYKFRSGAKGDSVTFPKITRKSEAEQEQVRSFLPQAKTVLVLLLLFFKKIYMLIITGNRLKSLSGQVKCKYLLYVVRSSYFI